MFLNDASGVFSPHNLFYKIRMQKLYMENIFTLKYLVYIGND